MFNNVNHISLILPPIILVFSVSREDFCFVFVIGVKCLVRFVYFYWQSVEQKIKLKLQKCKNVESYTSYREKLMFSISFLKYLKFTGRG